MKRYAAFGFSAALAILAWRLIAESTEDRRRRDRDAAYRRWAEWSLQDAAFRRRWAL